MAIRPAKDWRNETESNSLAGAIDAAQTAITLGTTTSPSVGAFQIQVDDERMDVTAGFGTVNLTVVRGASGTVAVPHAAGAVVRYWTPTSAAGLEDLEKRGFDYTDLVRGEIPAGAVAATASLRTLGTGATQAAPGNIMATYQPRQVKVTRAAAQSIANGTLTTVAWDAESYDLPTGSNQHDNVTNNPRLTCVEPGLYAVLLATDWAGNNTGQRNAYIRLNGTTYLGQDERGAVNAGGATVSPPPVRLAVGDYVEAQVSQTSGAALGFTGSYGFGWVRVGV